MNTNSNEEMTLEKIVGILENLKSAPSGISMSSENDYRFEVIEVRSDGEINADGFLLRCGFIRPDTTTGEMGEGFGRWNYFPKNSSEKSVIMTAFVAIKLVVEHEMLEAFEFKGTKLFNPHKTLDELSFPEVLPKTEKNEY